jgi:SpoIID/LytB domain protein
MRDGELIDAVYSANCGGHTEHNDNVWSSKPEKALRGTSDLFSNAESFSSPLRESQLSRWLRTVPKAYCADPRAGSSQNFRWEAVFTAKEMNALVKKYRNIGAIRDIKVLKRGVSGRALRVKVLGTRSSFVIYKELEIRRVLGRLKSTMFVLEIMRDKGGAPNTFVFRGGGWGHGVGLCQAGAEGMALRGHSYEAILTHYFSGAEIEELYK